MKINTNKLIKVSLILIVVGAALLAVGHLLGGRAGVAFSGNGVTSPYAKQKSYTLKKTKIDSFADTDIRIGSYADIRILPSRDDQFYLEYKLDGEYGEPFWEVRDDTLTLTHTGRQKQFGFAVNFFYLGTFGIQDGIKNAEVNLYIPEGEEMGQLNLYRPFRRGYGLRGREAGDQLWGRGAPRCELSGSGAGYGIRRSQGGVRDRRGLNPEK